LARSEKPLSAEMLSPANVQRESARSLCASGGPCAVPGIHPLGAPHRPAGCRFPETGNAAHRQVLSVGGGARLLMRGGCMLNWEWCC